jgi:hypothetical protein
MAKTNDEVKGTEPRHNPRLIGTTKKTGFPPLLRGSDNDGTSRPPRNSHTNVTGESQSSQKP